MFERLPCKRFRDTPSVRFFDVTVETSNARDLVTHAGPAVSPPDDPETGAWQFYLHPHQKTICCQWGSNVLPGQSPGQSRFTLFGWRAVETFCDPLERFTVQFLIQMGLLC